MTIDAAPPPGIIGQDAAWRVWDNALRSERMHHAWLFAGSRGLGKQALVRAAALSLVRQPGDADPDFAAHPDILVLQPAPATEEDAKKKVDGKEFKTKRSISVDQVRAMQRRLITRPTLGARRAIVIDTADELEKGAVNALLKSLEEPPEGTIFLLIAHHPGRLLPTVRSRCRTVRFLPLGGEALAQIIRRDHPEVGDQAIATAIAAAEGSPGMALAIIEHDLVKVATLMASIVERGDGGGEQRASLADLVGPRATREKLLAILDLARSVLAASIHSAPMSSATTIAAHSELLRLSAQAPTFNFEPGLLVYRIGGLLASAALPREAA